MSEIEIQKDVPLPPVHRPTREGKYPFHEMEVNESFLVTDVKASTVQSCAARYMRSVKGVGKKFAVRTTDEGVRVWRTE